MAAKPSTTDNPCIHSLPSVRPICGALGRDGKALATVVDRIFVKDKAGSYGNDGCGDGYQNDCRRNRQCRDHHLRRAGAKAGAD